MITGTKAVFAEITTQPKNNNLSYVIDPIFRSTNRFFAISFENGINDATRDSFEKYYMSLAKIRYFNVLIDNKAFFEHDYTIGNLLKFL